MSEELSGNMAACQTTTAGIQETVLDWAALDALITRMQREQLNLMLPGKTILAGADYLVIAGRSTWDLWHETGWLPLSAFVSGKFKLLNVDFRRTPYVDVDKAYIIRTWNEGDKFLDFFRFCPRD